MGVGAGSQLVGLTWSGPALLSLLLAAGGCGTSGRLSPEEAQAMRRYQTRMRLLMPGSAALAGLLAEVTALVAGLPRPGPEAAAEAAEGLAEPAGKRQRQ